MRERCTRRVVLASSEMSRLWRPAAVGVFAVAASCFVAGAASVGAIAQVQSAAGFQAPRDAIQPLTGPARVKGRVIFADTGAPVRDFMVTLTAANSGFALTATTDDDGAFDFRDVPLSTFSLRLRKTGYVPVSTSIPLQWLKDRVTVATASVGAGKLYLMGSEVAFRGQTHGTFKLLFNALYLATAKEDKSLKKETE